MEEGDPELVEAIKEQRWRQLPDLTARDYAFCALAEKLSGTPTRMVEGDWQPLRDLGLDDEACLEVAHVVSLFNYMTRMADGFGLQLHPDVLKAAETGVPLKRKSE